MHSQQKNTALRQAEVIMVLSLATDFGTGYPTESAMCSALLSIRFGHALGLSETLLREIYYGALLSHIGCTAEVKILRTYFGDDYTAAGAAWALINPQHMSQMFGWMLQYVAPGENPVERIRKFATLPNQLTEVMVGTCEVGQMLAQRLGFGSSIAQSIWQTHESWDGRGSPRKLKGEALTLPTRIIHIAHGAELYRRAYGVEAAVGVVKERAGSVYDPQLAAQFCDIAPSLMHDLEDQDHWNAVLANEPGVPHYLTEEELDNAALVIADFIDLLSPYFTCHSRNVADLAAAAARIYGLADADVKTVQRTGWLHDLGKIAVPAGIWLKEQSLTRSEWERVRLHPYYTERLTAQVPVLAHLGECAALHHERLDGSGYHRGIDANGLPPSACLIAAANFYQALTEPRAFRNALTAEAAAEQLHREVRAGRLDSDAVKAVLAAAGHHMTPIRRERVAGLTDREIEVLTLLTSGLTNREMAQRLTLSDKTVRNHIMHIYEKINVSTRSAATLFAVQHHLIGKTN